jgi:transcriptional regulator with XRE-family HTH domain
MSKNNLRNVLDNEGISQIDLARACNVSNGTINKVYNQRRTPSPKTMSKILKGLNRLAENEYVLKDIFPKLRVRRKTDY